MYLIIYEMTKFLIRVNQNHDQLIYQNEISVMEFSLTDWRTFLEKSKNQVIGNLFSFNRMFSKPSP